MEFNSIQWSLLMHENLPHLDEVRQILFLRAAHSVKRCLGVPLFLSLSRRQDLDPVPVRILDEIHAHRLVFKADAAHFRMVLERAFHVVRRERQMVLDLAEVVRLAAVLHPGELELEIAFAVTEEDNRELRLVVPADRLQPERLIVELQASLKIEHIEIKMIERKHSVPHFLNGRAGSLSRPRSDSFYHGRKENR